MPKPMLWIGLIVAWIAALIYASPDAGGSVAAVATIVFLVLAALLGYVSSVERRLRESQDERISNLESDLRALRAVVSRLEAEPDRPEAESQPARVAAPARHDEKPPVAATAARDVESKPAPPQPAVAPPAPVVAPIAARVTAPETAPLAAPKVPPPVPAPAKPAAPVAAPLPAKPIEPPRPVAAALRAQAAPSAVLIAPRVAAPVAPAPPRKRFAGVEELVGTNWLPKLGIVLIVGGLVSLLVYKWNDLTAWTKIGLGLLSGIGTLAAGVRLEIKERYRLFGRCCIGGGWAMLFFTSYAMFHVPATRVLPSSTVDLVLMLAIALGMVGHSLRYRSQLVTTLSFLLCFASIAVNTLEPEAVHAGVSSLAAAILLAAGLAIVAVRMQWYELEVLGLVATYVNHFFWVRPLVEAAPHREFEGYFASTVSLLLYWAIFRGAYVVHKIASKEDEATSSVAAILNSFLLLWVTGYQSAHPELAFRFFLTLGAVELGLSLLPMVRRRRTAYALLATMGTALITTAIPYRFGDSPARLALVWLIEGQVFFLAGAFADEIIFRRLGLLVSFVTSAWLFGGLRLEWAAAGLAQRSIVFFAAAAGFWADALAVPRRWKNVVANQVDELFLRVLSYVAPAMCVIGLWMAMPEMRVAVAWAGLALLLAIGGQLLASFDLGCQVLPVSLLAVLRFLVVDAHEPGMNRLVNGLVLIALLHACAAFSGFRDEWRRVVRVTHNIVGCALLAYLISLQLAAPWIAVGWIGAAVAWLAVARWRDLPELAYSADALAIGGLFVAVSNNLDATGRISGLSVRLVTGALLVVGYYLVAWISGLGGKKQPALERILHNTWAAAVVVALIWLEASQGWPVVWWIATALIWVLVARLTGAREFTIHGDLLAMGAVFVTLFTAFTSDATFHGILLRSITVPLVAAGAYLLSRWSGDESLEITRDSGHVFTWSGSLLVAVLIWYELLKAPIAVAPAWLLFGIVLLEIGLVRDSVNLRAQGYAALTASFVRMLFANLAADKSGSIATLIPLVAGFLYVYWRLTSAEAQASSPASNDAESGDLYDRVAAAVAANGSASRTVLGQYHAYLGIAALALLVRFQVMPEWVATAWAGMALALALGAWLLERPIFLHQALLLTAAVGYRALFYNLPLDSDPRVLCVGAAALLLLGAMGLGFLLRRETGASDHGHPLRLIAAHPEQVWFFTPMVLLTVLFVVVMPRGSTVAWGVEGVLAFLFALAVKERSFRLAGLSLLLLSVAKIVLFDVWRLHGVFRFLTFTVLGCALLLVSLLYTHYREQLRQLL